MEKSLTSVQAGLLLFLLLAINGFALRRWCLSDTRPLSWDESIHTRLALEYNDRIKNEGFAAVLKPAYFNYPPLYHLLLGRVVNRTSDIGDAGAFVNFFFLAGLMIVVFLLGKNLINPMAGLTAALFVSAYPAVVDLTRQPMIDLALTFWVTLSIYFLLLSDGFAIPEWSLAFGLSLGLGLLTKWSAGIYVMGPLLWSLARGVRNKTIGWFFVSCFLAALVAAPWYTINLFPMLTMFKRVTNLIPASGLVLTGAASWLWYPLSMGDALNGYFLLLLIPGLAACFWRPKLVPIFLWLVVSLFLFSLIHNRNIRYMVPALPAAALLSVGWLPSERKIPLIIVFLGGLTFFGLIQFAPSKRVVVDSFTLFQNQPPARENWHHKDVIERVAQLNPNESSFSRVIVLSNAAYFHSTTLEVSRERLGVSGISFEGPSKNRWMDFVEFILVKTGQWGPDYSIGTVRPLAEWVQKPPEWFKKSYRMVGRWPLPDGTEAILYQVSPVPLPRMESGVLNLSLGEFKLPNIELKNMRLRVSGSSAKETALGHFKEVSLECSKLIYKGMDFDNVSIRFLSPRLNLPRFAETGEIQFFSADTLLPRASVSSGVLLDYVRQKAKWLADPKISFEGDRLHIAGAVHGFPLDISLLIHVAGENLTTQLEHARFAGVSIPSLFFLGLTDREIQLSPNPEFPFHVAIRSIQGKKEKLEVNGL